MIYKKGTWPILARFEAEWVHEQTLAALLLAQKTALGRSYLKLLAGDLPQTAVSLCGLNFPNIVGMAAGFDKDARVVAGLALLGFGHIEVGTLTPRPQAGNPRPRIFRLKADQALINRMGFPNGGVQNAIERLNAISNKAKPFILGVSLGKQKETPLAEAVHDYVAVMRQVYAQADYLVINISSPNTPGLRQLQGGDYLGHLLKTLQAETAVLAKELQVPPRPLMVKIAPDLSRAELDKMLESILMHQIDGIIATNSSLNRAGLTSTKKHETGGLSGAPLRERSNEIIATIHRETNGRLPIIGVGGVRTADDVKAKIDAGASLVQLYTGLVYEGPGLVGRILRQL